MAPAYYFCDICATKIELDNPRVHCLDCLDYDLCANCALGQRFNGTHTTTHRTQVLKNSGGGVHPPVPSAIVISYGSPPATATTTTTLEAGMSSLAVGVSAYTTPPRDNAPPQLPPRSTSQSAYQPPAHKPLPPAPAPPTQVATGWGPFFLDDLSPTPVFTQLMSAILTYLDTGRTGYLVPEAYANFLEDQAYPLETNTWKFNLKATHNQSAVDAADAALKRVYDLFSIEYVLRPRAGNPNVAGGGTMPLLTLNGFIDITSVELLSDPSAEWGCLSRVVRAYALPAVEGWGALPRSVLPEGPDPRTEARVARVKTVSIAQGQEMLEAARMEAMIQAQVSQTVVDLFDDRRRYYTYY